MILRKWMRVAAALLVTAGVPARLDAQVDPVTRARELAFAGQRAESIALLESSLETSPNGDARVFLGTVLSWEGRYDEARRELEEVLAANPTHGDALPALINVELWSDHPARAEELANRALRNRPNDTAMLLARAKALSAQDRPTEARDTLDRLLIIDPRDDGARQMRRAVRESLRVWRVSAGSSYQAFSDRRVGWREADVSLSRATPIGSVGISAVRAQRFGREDDQFEVELYPRIRPGTYAYLAGAYSPDAVLFPVYRYAVDLNQSLGGGFEGSAGFRKLGFGSGVKIYTGSLTKYYGAWMFTGRTYITPKAAGTSRSYHGSFRRYFGESGAFAGLRYGRGGWREEVRDIDDFEVLASDVVAAEAVFVLRRRFEISVRSAYSREDRVERLDLRQYSLSTGLGFRF
jgi:YaiO family outer membrane protein